MKILFNRKKYVVVVVLTSWKMIRTLIHKFTTKNFIQPDKEFFDIKIRLFITF